MKPDEETSRDASEKLFYDFSSDRKWFLVLGGFVAVKRPGLKSALYRVYIALVYGVLTFLISTAVITMASTTYDKSVRVEALHTLGMLIVASALPIIRYLTRRSLDAAVDQLFRGLFTYDDEERSESYEEIKIKKVAHMKVLESYVQYTCLSCVFIYVVVIPIVPYFTQGGGSSDAESSSYLSINLYVPFDTRNNLGYGVIFAIDGVFLFFVYLVGICLVTTYLGCAFQLIAQIEILKHSLSTIEERTISRLRRSGRQLEDGIGVDMLYLNKDFQAALYACLKNNVLHHQAILRLSELMRPFMEGLNGLAIVCFSVILAASVILIIVNPNDNFLLIADLCTEIFWYLQLCSFGEEITQKSLDIGNCLYFTPWYMWDSQLKSSVEIIQIRTRVPIVFRATGFRIPSSLETFANMMSLGYKIINVIAV